MDEDINKLLCGLDDEINKKCVELKQKKADRMLHSAFITACALFIIVPILLVLAGLNLWAFFIPAILFLTISFCFLLPLVFSEKLGGLNL